MAKITGPLMSLDARGNWASGRIQFRGGLKSTHAYRPAPPGTINQAPATEAQTEIRATYHGIHDEWIALSPAERATWNEEATAYHGISGWNLYLKTRMLELLNGPVLPDPNTYVAPDGDSVIFPGITWVSDLDYTPPPGDGV